MTSLAALGAQFTRGSDQFPPESRSKLASWRLIGAINLCSNCRSAFNLQLPLTVLLHDKEAA